MFKEVSYEVLLRDHPDKVLEALDDLRKSRSKFKADAPESFKWGYDWAVMVNSLNLAEVLQRRGLPEPAPQTIEEQVADYGTRCRVKLVMQKKTSRFHSSLMHTPPQFILDEYRKNLEEREAERRRFNALSPEDQRKELFGNIRELQKSPGFMVLHVNDPEEP